MITLLPKKSTKLEPKEIKTYSYQDMLKHKTGTVFKSVDDSYKNVYFVISVDGFEEDSNSVIILSVFNEVISVYSNIQGWDKENERFVLMPKEETLDIRISNGV